MFWRIAAAGVLTVIASAWGGCSDPAPVIPAPTPLPRVIQIITEWASNGINSGPTTVGQSVTVAGGPFDQLRFRFLLPPGGEPANGTLFLLTREYLESQYELGAQTPGVIASTSRIEDGEFAFDPAFRIVAGKYWFMTNSNMRVYTTPGNQDLYPGGDAYSAGLSGPFTLFTPTKLTDRSDILFQLRGSLVAP